MGVKGTNPMKHEIPLESYDDEVTLAEAMKRFRVEAKENTTGGVEKFTPNHRVWDVAVYMDDELIYRTNFQSCDYPKGGEVWQCLAQDAMAYEENTDLADFLECFDYLDNASSTRKGIAAYEGCKRTNEILRAKGIKPIDLAGLFSEAENADVLDVIPIDIDEG